MWIDADRESKSLTLSLSIDNVMEEHAGTYTCEFLTADGEESASTTVSITYDNSGELFLIGFAWCMCPNLSDTDFQKVN